MHNHIEMSYPWLRYPDHNTVDGDIEGIWKISFLHFMTIFLNTSKFVMKCSSMYLYIYMLLYTNESLFPMFADIYRVHAYILVFWVIMWSIIVWISELHCRGSYLMNIERIRNAVKVNPILCMCEWEHLFF